MQATIEFDQSIKGVFNVKIGGKFAGILLADPQFGLEPGKYEMVQEEKPVELKAVGQ